MATILQQTTILDKSFKRYKFLFENSPIPIQETNISNITEALDQLKADGVTDIKTYVAENPEFFSDLYYSAEIFDVNEAMLKLTEADSKAYYLENFKIVLGVSCFNFFKAIFIALFNGQNQLTGKTEIITFKGRKIWVEATAIFLNFDGKEIINYTFKEITEIKLKDDAIKLINERLVTGSFQEHLNNLVLALSEAFQLSQVFIGIPSKDKTKITTLSFSDNYQLHESVTYNLSKAPCFKIYQNKEKVVYTNYLNEIFPNNNAIQVWKGKSYMGYPLVNKKGKIIGHFAFVNNQPLQKITALKDVMELYAAWASTELEHLQNQRQLEQKNKELERYIESNVQLENFAYVASHDLKAPIRTIISFSQLLQRNLKGKLDDDGREFLDFIINASKNMKALVEDLLLFSRIDNQKLNKRTLKVSDILLAISSEIQTTIQEKNALISWQNIDDEIEGDKIKLKQLLQNLITNAIKFQRPNIQPIIKISGKETATHWQFSVQDNGIGIDSNYFDRVFAIFQKVHSTNEYEGTGLGLAICKKIVEQHHGEIWVTSTVGKGTTFHFTIAK